MDFTVGKCNTMQLSNARHNRSFTFTIQELPLCIVDHLGYCPNYDHKLSWEAYQNYVSAKVNRLLIILNRNLPTDNQCLHEYSYKQLMLPVLDYCATIWDPYYLNAVHGIVMLQNRMCYTLCAKPSLEKALSL